MSYFDEISQALADLASADPEEIRQVLRQYDVRDVQAVTINEGGGGGGSQPGVLTARDFVLTEQTTAGVYTASLPIGAGTLLWDILIIDLSGVQWESNINDVSLLQIGDDGDAEGYLSPSQAAAATQNLSNGGLDGTNPGSTAGNMISTAALNHGNYSGAGMYNETIGWTRRYTADDTIAIVLTTEIETPPGAAAGQILIKILYYTPATETEADFT